MTLTNKIGFILFIVFPIACFFYLLGLPQNGSHYGTGTAPLALAAQFMLWASWSFTDGRCVDSDFLNMFGAIFFVGGLAFYAIFGWVLFAGYPITPA